MMALILSHSIAFGAGFVLGVAAIGLLAVALDPVRQMRRAQKRGATP